MKKLTVALLVFSVFAPTVFTQTVEQKELKGPVCVEIIRGTERHFQCENVITPTAEQTGEKSLPRRKGRKAHAKRLTPEQRKASPVYLQMRDFEDGPEGPIISVAR